MTNHNRPVLRGTLGIVGLAKAKDLYSWWFLDPHDMVAKWKARERADAEARHPIVVRPFNLGDFDAEVERASRVYNQSMENNWGFVSLSEEEFRYMGRRLRELGDPNLALLAEVDGQPVGFSITLPDINEAIQPLDGRLFPTVCRSISCGCCGGSGGSAPRG